MNMVRSLSAALVSVVFFHPIAAQAQIFKCAGAGGSVTYKATACGAGEADKPTTMPRSLTISPKEAAAAASASVPGGFLWETSTTKRTEQQSGQGPSSPSSASDYRSAFGTPIVVTECTDRKPIEDYMATQFPRMSCERQMKSGGGTCIVKHSQMEWTLTGNYTTAVSIKQEHAAGIVAASGVPPNGASSGFTPPASSDSTLVGIRQIGACKPGMKLGERFTAEKDGTYTKVP